jgi:hypothetical protein
MAAPQRVALTITLRGVNPSDVEENAEEEYISG